MITLRLTDRTGAVIESDWDAYVSTRFRDIPLVAAMRSDGAGTVLSLFSAPEDLGADETQPIIEVLSDPSDPDDPSSRIVTDTIALVGE